MIISADERNRYDPSLRPLEMGSGKLLMSVDGGKVEGALRQFLCGQTAGEIRLEVSEEEQEGRLVAPSRTGGKLRRVEVLRLWQKDVQSALAEMPTPALSIDTTATSPEAAAS